MNELLIKEEAYMAMYNLLNAIYERAPDISLGTILSDMQLDDDDIPFDRAYKNDWSRAIEKAKAVLDSMNEYLLTKEEAYMAMYNLLEIIFERAPDIALGTILGDMQLDDEGVPFDSAYKHHWAEAIEKAKSK